MNRRKEAVVGTDYLGRLQIKTPYKAGFIADLKNGVSFGYRHWDGTNRIWLVTLSEQADRTKVIGIVRQHYSDVKVLMTDILKDEGGQEHEATSAVETASVVETAKTASKPQAAPKTDEFLLECKVKKPMRSYSYHDVRLMPF